MQNGMFKKVFQHQLLIVLVLSAPGYSAAQTQSQTLNVPAGFRADLYAGDDLAHDIHSLTIDSHGRVVVSGPGYVRTLLDQDDDGRADGYTQFSDKPASGSQGMYFLGSALLCSGDEGLLLFRDANRDGVADGPPRTFLKISAGGEHHVHSIQKGPDGWWYINAGNYAGVTSSYANLPTSPLRDLHGGVLMRLTPDLSGGEVISDGFRNAYDFTFAESGDVFTFDSDGERDITLPWYRPIRVLQVTPMSNAGWVTRSWKRPASFADMPPVVASFGRGSPTGVLCYRHSQFPSPYRNAIFVLDWTMGRVFALPLQADGSVWESEPIEFATAKGRFGFAPTDAAVGPDGSLFVSVGGRGTRGGVFRIVHEQGLQSMRQAAEDTSTKTDLLQTVLSADQPLTSWSREIWTPVARKLGPEPFRNAAIDERRRVAERVRAIEILVQLFGEPSAKTAAALSQAGATAVRARTAWAAGRVNPASPDMTVISRLLSDREPLVQRFALEALVGVRDTVKLSDALPGLAHSLASADRHVRLAAAVLVNRLSPRHMMELRILLTGQPVGRLWMAMGQQLRPWAVNTAAAKLAVEILTSASSSPELQRDSVRLLQLSLGDVGPAAGRPAMFDSYRSPFPLERHETQLNPLLTNLTDIFPTGQPDLDYELIRVIAMTSPYNRELFKKILNQIDDDTAPSNDIHCLATLARFELERSFEETTATAHALLEVDVKVKNLGLRQDSNWDDRIGELYARLCEVDPALPQLLVDQPIFGQPGHVLYMSNVPQPAVEKAIDKFVAVIEADDSFHWTNDVVFLLGESDKAEYESLLREQLDNLAVRDAVLMELADTPQRDDRELFVSGLESSQLNAVEACAKALQKLPRSNAASEQFALLSAARRLVNDDRDFRLRELVVRLLQNNTGRALGFVFGPDGHKLQPDAMRSWQEYLESRYPDFHPVSSGEVAQTIYAAMQNTRWETGDVAKGKRLFERLSCGRCHGGRKALGPDLTGVTKRFSRDDLFASIVEPDRDVSSRYQTTSIVTTSGKVFSGLIVYQSVDGMLLRDANQNTYRFEQNDIESQHRQRASLMPAGLLKGVDRADLADLYRYLQSL
jgi:putative membrane-bound dehydrogenase-like protein